MTGYRLHIECDQSEAEFFYTMKALRVRQKQLAKEWDRTLKEIEHMSYIMTEDEFQEEHNQE